MVLDNNRTMIYGAVKKSENRGIAFDDQQLAEVESLIARSLDKREKINLSLRKLKRVRKAILERRHLTDTSV